MKWGGLTRILALLGLLGSGGRAQAHPLAPIDLTAVLTPARAELSLDLGWHVLTADVADPDAADAFLETQLHLTGAARTAWVTRLRTWFAPRIHLVCDSNPVPLHITLPGLETPGQAELPPETLPSLRVEAAAPFPRPPRACVLGLDETLGTVVLHLRRPGRAVDDVRLLSPGVNSPPFAVRGDDAGGANDPAASPPDRLALSSDPAARPAGRAPAAAPTSPPEPGVADSVAIGFEHILPAGLDHVLFVLALFFLGSGRPIGLLFWQVTAFTLAHSLTLALGMAGFAHLPAHVVEPAIAASIAFVALEDMFVSATPKTLRRRIAVVFLFGLVHGLGFASALQAAGLPQGRWLVTVVGFNVGVELGQLTVLAAAFVVTWPLLGWRHFENRVRRPVCLGIAATGLYWMFERLA